MQTTGGSMNTTHTLSMHTIPSIEQIVLIRASSSNTIEY